MTGQFQPGLSGQLVSNGDLLLRASQVYATTGTGDLQQLLEDRRAGVATKPNPFLIASSLADGKITFAGLGGAIPATPLSAGSYIKVVAANIQQNGILRAPLGLLELGSNAETLLVGQINAPATEKLNFGPNSLTSVSARTSASGDEALNVPYGTTTDLIEYFFAPGTNKVLTATPSGELRFAGKDIEFTSSSGEGVSRCARRRGCFRL